MKDQGESLNSDGSIFSLRITQLHVNNISNDLKYTSKTCYRINNLLNPFR